jgi:hypothetical protein
VKNIRLQTYLINRYTLPPTKKNDRFWGGGSVYRGHLRDVRKIACFWAQCFSLKIFRTWCDFFCSKFLAQDAIIFAENVLRGVQFFSFTGNFSCWVPCATQGFCPEAWSPCYAKL